MSMTPPQLVADRYRLIEPLGQGGMGRVWLALDEVLHREVAIKELVPPPGLTDEERREMRERSLREARAIARLNHINVVRIFDVLRTDGDPWIVMEYVASRSLQDVIATDGPLPAVRVAEIGLGMLGALRAAHRAGVVHRDIKPANVLLAEDGRVVLTDWGLATMPGDPTVTRTGLVLGSPAYIAPERARDGTSGPRTDMWSFGATLYAAVEGQSPFARLSALATLAALATEPPAPARHAGALRPVLNGLLRKDPADRIDPEETDRLLRRASGRKTVARRPLLDGVRRPTALRDRMGNPGGAAIPAPTSPGAPTPTSPGAPTPTSPGAPSPISPAARSSTSQDAPTTRPPHNPPGAGVWPVSPAAPTPAPLSPAAPHPSPGLGLGLGPTAHDTRPVVVPGSPAGPTAGPTSPPAPTTRPTSPAARPTSPAAR
ncbi:MAG TPA: protein kinase, partial [Asanoa sp.]|nr:protein kinase [Asanoa sp.]